MVKVTRYDESYLPPEIEEMLNKSPNEFGKALALRHLKMVQDAMKKWAKAKNNPTP